MTKSSELSQEEADRIFDAKLKALLAATEKVESILGVTALREGDSVSFFRVPEHASRAALSATDYEANRLLILVTYSHDGTGHYCPDAFDPSEHSAKFPLEYWFNEEAPWKAAVLEELRPLLPLDEIERGYFDYATRVFRGEVIHPSVLDALR